MKNLLGQYWAIEIHMYSIYVNLHNLRTLFLLFLSSFGLLSANKTKLYSLTGLKIHRRLYCNCEIVIFLSFFRVNTRISFYQKMAAIYQAYQCAKADLHNAEFCSWAAEPGASCDGVSPCNEDFFSNLTQFECDLEPVLPQRYV